jgi:uncharacterized protein YjeT (DUF2065 family)|tara:strand:- start:993 stop:1394 length:402 start_codon:yes stop_codon:yes gene_type:complete
MLETHATMTVILAKAYGIYFTVVGLALLADPTRFRKWYEDIFAETRRALFGGTISLVIGCFIIATHNHLVPDWRIILTGIGYWGVFSGAGCLISGKFIQLFRPMVDSSDLVYRLSGLAWGALGLFLAYKGFGM